MSFAGGSVPSWLMHRRGAGPFVGLGGLLVYLRLFLSKKGTGLLVRNDIALFKHTQNVGVTTQSQALSSNLIIRSLQTLCIFASPTTVLHFFF